MTIILPQESTDPLYKQVRNALAAAIRDGQFRQVPLPSSRALALELGISRNTVNLAYQEMVAEGLIESEERVGYHVNTEIFNKQLETVKPVNQGEAVNWDLHLRPRLDSYLSEIKKDYEWHAYPYPFIYGQVARTDFPIAAWNRALRTSMEYPHVHMSLRDNGSEDDPLLIEQLRTTVLASRGIHAAPEEILVTLGAQNGLFLATRSILWPHDKVVVENPGYPDTAHILANSGAKLCPIEVDSEGLRADLIPQDVRVISVTPSHQFPTNVNLSKSRRDALLAVAQRNDALILEDDYDAELRYVGRPASALRAANNERVVYIGSFSKFLAPGLRVGYVVAAPALIERMRKERRYTLRHPPGQVQRALALMIATGDYQRALRKQRLALREKWILMTKMLTQAIGDSFQPPTGGTSMWVPLPDGVMADKVVDLAARQGILIESGSPCFADGHPEQQRFIRIGYAAIPIDSIGPGLRALMHVINRERRKSGA